jgi:hypothetical protein
LNTIENFPAILEDSRGIFEKVRDSAAEELKRTEYDDEYTIETFCSERTATIQINGQLSGIQSLPQAGLPQGSPLTANLEWVYEWMDQLLKQDKGLYVTN